MILGPDGKPVRTERRGNTLETPEWLQDEFLAAQRVVELRRSVGAELTERQIDAGDIGIAIRYLKEFDIKANV